MVVEDAASLAVALDQLCSLDDLTAVVEKLMDVRKTRTKCVYAASMGHGLILHLPDGKCRRRGIVV